MEPLTARKEAVLNVIDEQIQHLEVKLRKVQPLLDELNSLRATRRVLLSERTTTGAGASRHTLSMESVILYLKEHGPSMPQEIADALGVPSATVRAHLSRHKDERYVNTGQGWCLTEDSEDGE